MSARPLALLNNNLEASIADELLAGAAGASLPFELRLAPAFDVPDADRDRVVALLVHGHTKVDAELLARFPRLRVVSNHGVGIDHIDVPACTASSVIVYNTPDTVTGATADIAFALLLAVARRVVEGDAIARAPDTVRYSGTWFGSEVHSSVLGIVGMGRIGTAVARRARGFEMSVRYFNRNRAPADVEASLGAADGHCRYCASLEELLPECDFVVVAAPATPATRHMIAAPQLALMRKSAFLINVSRGSLVDQDALVSALDGGVIAGAGLDVTEPEPLPRDHPLLRCRNVTLTPHVGTATRKTRVVMAKLALANLTSGLGLPPSDGVRAISAVNDFAGGLK